MEDRTDSVSEIASAGLSAELRRLREKKGLGILETAQRASVSAPTLSNWESGRRNPSGAALDPLLRALDVPARDRARLLAQADPAYARLALADDPLGPPVDLGQILRSMRVRSGLTQSEAAKRAGMTQSAIAKWESGDSVPSGPTLHTALFVLGATPEEAEYVLSAQFAPPRDDGKTVWERMDTYRDLPSPLQDVGLMAMEREFWAGTARNPEAPGALIAAMARRAHLYLLQRRYEEAEALGLRTLRMAETTGGWDEAYLAQVAVGESRWMRTGDPESAVAFGRRCILRLRHPHLRAIALGQLAVVETLAGERISRDVHTAGIERIATESPDSRGILVFGTDSAEMLLFMANTQLFSDDPEGCLETLSLVTDPGAEAVVRVNLGIARLRALLRIGERPTEAMERAVMPIYRSAWALYVHEREIFDRNRELPLFGAGWHPFRTGFVDRRPLDDYVKFLH